MLHTEVCFSSTILSIFWFESSINDFWEALKALGSGNRVILELVSLRLSRDLHLPGVSTLIGRPRELGGDENKHDELTDILFPKCASALFGNDLFNVFLFEGVTGFIFARSSSTKWLISLLTCIIMVSHKSRWNAKLFSLKIKNK